MSNEHDVPALSATAIRELRTLIERIDRHRDQWDAWNEWGSEQTEKNGYIIPNAVMSEIVWNAMEFLYDHGLIIQFNWAEWDEGRDIFRRTNEHRFDTLDRITVLKLLTAIARNDRFFEGAWAGIFEDGSAQKLFRRLLETEDHVA